MKKALLFLMTAAMPALFACGPFFPISYLAREAPRRIDLELGYHLELLARKFHSELLAYDVSGKAGESTAEATRQDFIAAVGENPALLERYLAFDAACRRGETPEEEIPAGRAREFYLYSRGYAEMFRDPAVTEPAAWRELLKLSPVERKYRTTWVHYMLGNLALKSGGGAACKHYRELREAAGKEGFADTAGLARRSYWVHFSQSPEALERLRNYPFYIAATGTPANNRDFRKLVKAAELEDAAGLYADPYLRELRLLGDDPETALTKIPKGTELLMPERLAALFYFAGDAARSKALLERVPADSLIRLYLEARFARRDGDADLAASKLRRWLLLYRKNAEIAEITFSPLHQENLYELFDKRPRFRNEVEGVLGSILVEKRDFLEALHAFMLADSWNDAAIVAEELLPTVDLVNYCRAHTAPGGLFENHRLRHLLARRLMREYRVIEAGEWFPAEVKPYYDLYVAASRRANDAALSAEERALALFELGRIFTQKGFELRATELAPDYFVVGGSYNWLPSDDWTDAMTDLQGESVRRLWVFEKNKRPADRYHYRRNAAHSFGRAALLATDPVVRSAALWAAGDLLKHRYPDEANAYYLMLCDGGESPLAAAARGKGWFPDSPSLGKLIREVPLEKPVVRADFDFLGGIKK